MKEAVISAKTKLSANQLLQATTDESLVEHQGLCLIRKWIYFWSEHDQIWLHTCCSAPPFIFTLSPTCLTLLMLTLACAMHKGSSDLNSCSALSLAQLYCLYTGSKRKHVQVVWLWGIYWFWFPVSYHVFDSTLSVRAANYQPIRSYNTSHCLGVLAVE